MSSNIPVTYDLFHLGAVFEVDLKDCLTNLDYDGVDITEQFIIIYKPDKTIITKIATISETAGLTTLQYINGTDNPTPETESILDLIGPWEFAGKVKLTNNDQFQTSERFHLNVS